MFTTNHGRESAAADCLRALEQSHHRCEAGLRQLAAAVEGIDDGELTEARRTALEVALHAFSQHRLRPTDEETVLFARLRSQSGLEIRRVCPKLDLLEEDFWAARFYAERVERIGRHWLAQDHITRSEYAVLCSALRELFGLYQRHLRIEGEVFPLAERVLTQAA